MKTYTMFGLALAALCGMEYAPAQDAAAGKLEAVVQMGGKKRTKIQLAGAQGENILFAQKGTDQLLSQPVSGCKVFYIMTPADLASALQDYRSDDLADARKKLSACRLKYAAYAALPGNPSTAAAVAEMDCCARLMDWKALDEVCRAFPGANSLAGPDKLRYQAAKILAKLKDPAGLDAAKDDAAKFIKGNIKKMDSETYAWMRYIVASSYAAKVPAAELQGGISEKNQEAASKAVDNFCQCVMSVHGNIWPMQKDALVKSLHLLYAMPGVKEYAARNRTILSAGAWNGGPADFRDAVALAYMMKNLYEMSSADPLIDELAGSFYNAAKDRKAAAEAEAEGGEEKKEEAK